MLSHDLPRRQARELVVTPSPERPIEVPTVEQFRAMLAQVQTREAAGALLHLAFMLVAFAATRYGELDE